MKLSIILTLITLISLPLSGQVQFKDGQIVYLQSAAFDVKLYLSAKAGATSPGTMVAVQNKNHKNETACQWKLESAGSDWYYLRNVKSGLYLDVRHGIPKGGAAIWLQRKGKVNSQQVRFEAFKKEPSLYFIKFRFTEKWRVLDLNSTLPTSGIRAILNQWEQGRRVQKWRVLPVNTTGQYKVTLRTIRCEKVSDPGDEVEIFGNIKTRAIHNRSPLTGDITLFNRSSKQLIDLRQGQNHNVFSSHTFTVDQAQMDRGKIYFDLIINLYEHDSTSANEEFIFGDHWRLNDGLGYKKTATMEVEGTVLEVTWNVEKL